VVTGLTPDSLAANDAFISAFAHATQAALITHQKEKLDALRNAVANVAVGNAPSEDLQTRSLNLVDSFTPKHLQALDYVTGRNPALRDRLLTQSDLVDRARGRDTPQCVIHYQWNITPMGEEFLAFIKSPSGA
jgi:hypothetical protein